jgi:hypothetical protein
MILAQLAMAAHTTHAATASPSTGTWLIAGVFFLGGLIVGRLWGRRTGLKHLGAAEFNARMRNVRGVRRF